MVLEGIAPSMPWREAPLRKRAKRFPRDLANSSASLRVGNAEGVLENSPGLPVRGLPWENAPPPQPRRWLWRGRVDDAVNVSSTHNAQALLATTSFRVGGAAPHTPGSPQTGNLGPFSRTPLAFPTRRPPSQKTSQPEDLPARRPPSQKTSRPEDPPKNCPNSMRRP
jgi:hypothetical protein